MLFDGLEISVRRYAVRRSRDAGAVSRYLNGTRIPPWEFILELARDVAAHRGESIKSETLEFLRRQHHAALEIQGNVASVLQLTRHQLAETDRKAQQGAIQVQVLTDALKDRQALLDDVELQLRQVQHRDALREIEVVNLTEERDALLAERLRLQGEVTSLKGELNKAKMRAAEFESDCASLERRLALLEGSEERELAAAEPEFPSGSIAYGVLELVGFTRLTRQLNDAELISTVESLRLLCRRISASTGARFMHARGSQFTFACSSAISGAETGLRLVELKESHHVEHELRVGLSYGHVFSSGGIVFGETVSRAESLCNVAPKDSVLADPACIEQLESEINDCADERARPSLTARDMWERPLRGLGVVKPWLVARA
ncbi:hypothetical protein GTY41_22520 [Streptomyces sp. SID685]|uniref:hypothetical protein n=1 Tax=Streptomyces sp. SID685 TaxID=2690322 RepID=UPI0013700B5B|nr:hypothetical protein [Streptomyces sp. SID685]MYR87630.1 hypothetical protein [Streptomyces sp. SID685]